MQYEYLHKCVLVGLTSGWSQTDSTLTTSQLQNMGTIARLYKVKACLHLNKFTVSEINNLFC